MLPSTKGDLLLVRVLEECPDSRSHESSQNKAFFFFLAQQNGKQTFHQGGTECWYGGISNSSCRSGFSQPPFQPSSLNITQREMLEKGENKARLFKVKNFYLN